MRTAPEIADFGTWIADLEPATASQGPETPGFAPPAVPWYRGLIDCTDPGCAADSACSGGCNFSGSCTTFVSDTDDKSLSDGFTCGDYDYCDGVDKVMIGSDVL